MSIRADRTALGIRHGGAARPFQRNAPVVFLSCSRTLFFFFFYQHHQFRSTSPLDRYPSAANRRTDKETVRERKRDLSRFWAILFCFLRTQSTAHIIYITIGGEISSEYKIQTR